MNILKCVSEEADSMILDVWSCLHEIEVLKTNYVMQFYVFDRFKILLKFKIILNAIFYVLI